MFKHGKTGYTYYSVNEKIKYYEGILRHKNGVDKGCVTRRDKEHAAFRLETLKGLKGRTFSEPDLIVTDDKKFGNGISKPRLCAVIDTDKKGRVLVSPVLSRTAKSIILDNDHNRQVGEKRKWIDRSDIYETKYIEGVPNLTRNDKEKIKKILRKNNSG